ncbi:MAG: F0F1 ATP synthase subunit delta [Armatimonadota bacterium]|nr:F0F1 ATP synthase subunit delta [bacterium]
MIEPRVVRRYASALFGAASQLDVVDRVESDLGLVSYVMETSPRLKETVESPVVPADKKRAILRDIFAEEVHSITLSYLYLLVDKRREEAILATESEYVTLANEARGIVAADVTTAVHLDPAEEQALSNKLAKMTGKSIHLNKFVDAAVIGGMVVKIGDRVIDGSIRGQLAELKERLLG